MLGMQFYGGTQGLYDKGPDEISRAMAAWNFHVETIGKTKKAARKARKHHRRGR